jgi:hypothetical protein
MFKPGNGRAQVRSGDAHAAGEFIRRIWRPHSAGFGFLAARNSAGWFEQPMTLPASFRAIATFLTKYPPNRFDIYFCPNAFRNPRRLAKHACRTPYAWCDIDDASPDRFEPSPTILVRTSPGRYQGIWEFLVSASARKAEAVSRALAYEFEADRNGWSCTKMLRVPHTLNHKPTYRWPSVLLVYDRKQPLSRWPAVELAPAIRSVTETLDPSKHDWKAVVRKYAGRMKHVRRRLIEQERVESPDRSRCIFIIVATLAEAGATPDEIASVLWRSPYFRDKHGPDSNKLGDEINRILQKIRATHGQTR